jgi:hypothetical protein
MVNKCVFAALAAVVATGAITGPASAKGGGTGGGGGGGGGGGSTKPVLPAPPIAPATFDGIGPGPVYVHESFGHAQGTRYRDDGSIIDANLKPEINRIRAEYPNNKAETWIADAMWKLSVTGPGDPYEPFSPLQVNEFGDQDGTLSIEGAEPGGPDTRPNALIPFPAPTGSASTVSADSVPFDGKTAIGFTTSSATTRNFESNGQVWLELDATGNFITGGNTNILRWTFHTNGLSGTTLSGTYDPSATGYTRMAVSYDPVNPVAAATVDGNVVASVPYTASSIKYAGLEGTLFGHADNFTVRTGTVTDQTG